MTRIGLIPSDCFFQLMPEARLQLQPSSMGGSASSTEHSSRDTLLTLLEADGAVRECSKAAELLIVELLRRLHERQVETQSLSYALLTSSWLYFQVFDEVHVDLCRETVMLCSLPLRSRARSSSRTWASTWEAYCRQSS